MRFSLCLLAVVLAGCGAHSNRGALGIERTFTVRWHDRASQTPIAYTTRRVAFHDGRWSAEISVHNGTDKPLYESAWALPGSNHLSWYGPALVYSGLDVLQNRKLIFVPADTEQPTLPYPLPPGATWHGTVSGKIPAAPPLPRGSDIWVRYPVFGVGAPYDGLGPSAVQWISDKAVEL